MMIRKERSAWFPSNMKHETNESDNQGELVMITTVRQSRIHSSSVR